MQYLLAAIGMLAIVAGPALADPWKDESGRGRWSYGYERGSRAYNMDREYKQEYYRGGCKIERKWGRNGEYKEETNCKGCR